MLESDSELCVFKLVHMHVTHWGTNLNTWWSVLGSPDGPGWSEVGGTGLVHVLYVYIQLCYGQRMHYFFVHMLSKLKTRCG